MYNIVKPTKFEYTKDELTYRLTSLFCQNNIESVVISLQSDDLFRQQAPWTFSNKNNDILFYIFEKGFTNSLWSVHIDRMEEYLNKLLPLVVETEKIECIVYHHKDRKGLTFCITGNSVSKTFLGLYTILNGKFGIKACWNEAEGFTNNLVFADILLQNGIGARS